MPRLNRDLKNNRNLFFSEPELNDENDEISYEDEGNKIWNKLTEKDLEIENDDFVLKRNLKDSKIRERFNLKDHVKLVQVKKSLFLPS